MEDRSDDGRLLEELRPALDAWAPEAARAAFRDAVRAGFLEGAVGAGAAEPGGRLSATLDSYSPAPRAGFRDGLREAFLAGAAAARPGEQEESEESAETDDLPELPEWTEPDEVVARRAPRAARATRTRFRVLVGGGIASFVAAAALVVWLLQPAARSWRVEAQGFSPVGIQVDGVALAADASPADLERLLGEARTLRSGERALRLVLGGDVAVLELDSDSRIDLSGVPEDPKGDIVLSGDEGGFRVATGAGFRVGSQGLSFRAHDVTVDVTGTVFGVDVYGADVCVCCCQGTVRVRAPGAAGSGIAVEESKLAAGETRYVHADGRSDFVRDLEDHQAPLRALRDYRDGTR